jgi:hypothetical protein
MGISGPPTEAVKEQLLSEETSLAKGTRVTTANEKCHVVAPEHVRIASKERIFLSG